MPKDTCQGAIGQRRRPSAMSIEEPFALLTLSGRL